MKTRRHTHRNAAPARGTAALALVALALLPAAVNAQVVEFYHLDALGNVRAISNQAGQIVRYHDYLPFGEEWNAQPDPQPRRFTGKERDTETGLDYFGARYYAASVGRFTTTDPVYTWRDNLVDPQRWNRYAYGRNNPLRYVDPDGRVLRTAELARMQEIAGASGTRVTLTNGSLDVSALTAADLQGNEGALLLHQMATSSNVYSYAEGTTTQTAAGPQPVLAAASNLNDRPDSRYSYRPGGTKLPAELPPAGVNDAVVINPGVSMFERTAAGTRGRPVSTRALAFHELAEAYATVDGGQQYLPLASGSHATAAARERALVSQRPNFTQGLAGVDLTR